MQTVIGFAVLALIGWIAISILPTILPYIGYAAVGLIVIFVIGAVAGK